ncbi:Protein CL16A [Coemansia javaensis]|uniref:Protein CL16A n=1 Tax=Coemansia javaensis TaxID=2761396 RepID=A0A9W8H6G3_9FUNG|nr:Protein CL16A [Coemansia javaensis]
MFSPFLTLLGIQQSGGGNKNNSGNDGGGSSGGGGAGGAGRPPEAAAETTNAEAEVERRRAQIHRLAAYLRSAKVGRTTEARIVESVRQVSEVVIWSDRHSSELLSVAVEEGLHRAMLGLLLGARARRRADGAVAVQILQTFSIILDSVTDAKFIYALFSNNFVNQVIAAPIDADNEEVLSYYVAFLKALSLRLTPSTIHFFFNELMDDFPLYTTAISLFDHPDSMVRVAVRAITLNVFRINDPDVLEFILNAPACTHFWEQVVCALRASYDDAFRILVDMLGPPAAAVTRTAASAAATISASARPGGGGGGGGGDDDDDGDNRSWAALDQVLELHMGLLAYLNDVLGLGVDRINRRICSEFRDRILARTYVHAIEVGWRSGASFEETLFMQVVTLFLAHFFSIVRHSPLLIDTVSALFSAGASGDENDDNDNDNDNEQQQPSRLRHPFIPSPFEPSRTLAPWLCAVLEVLRNKAISPTALAKSALTPRRMLRTRALLDSLTGAAPRDDVCSTASSVSARTVMAPPGAAAALGSPRQSPAEALPRSTASGSSTPHTLPPPPAGPLPPHTQAIAAGMVQVLADAPPTHSWITIDLAALVLAQLTRSARGPPALDPVLGAEAALAQRTHSAELRAMLLTAGDDAPAHGGSWKVLAQCLADLANRDHSTFTLKLQFEARHIFARQNGAWLESLPASAAASRKASASASAAAARPMSPFDSAMPRDALLKAAVHQALHLRRLARPGPAPAFVPALRRWLGEHVGDTPGPAGDDPVFAGAAVFGGSGAAVDVRVHCRDGFLVVYTQAAAPTLVWPLADATATEDPDPDGGVLRIADGPFPPLFFPPRPASLGGIGTATRRRTPTSPRARAAARGGGPQPRAAYPAPHHALDIRLRLPGPSRGELARLVSAQAAASRRALADILLAHDLV